MLEAYRNEPFTDFAVGHHKQAFQAALSQVQSELGKSYGPIIGGKLVATERQAASINPAATNQVIGIIGQADQVLAEEAIQTAAPDFRIMEEGSGLRSLALPL